MIFGAVIGLLSKILIDFFTFINDLVTDDYSYIAGESGLSKFIDFLYDAFDFLQTAENIFFLVLLVIGAVSLIKSDSIKLPIADAVLNKIIKKKNNTPSAE